METYFRYLNLFPMPLWLAMLFAPNHPLTERGSRSSTVFGVAALNYLGALLLALREGSGEGLPDFTTLDGIRRGLANRPGALAAWSHMLALDLFTGAWTRLPGCASLPSCSRYWPAPLVSCSFCSGGRWLAAKEKRCRACA